MVAQTSGIAETLDGTPYNDSQRFACFFKKPAIFVAADCGLLAGKEIEIHDEDGYDGHDHPDHTARAALLGHHRSLP